MRASSALGAVDYECRLPHLLLAPQLSLLSFVQTGCGFLSGGRRGATLDDRETALGGQRSR